MKFIGIPFFVLCCLAVVASAWGGSGDKVKLKDVQVLTLNVGQFTNGRRSPGVPQIKCVGGSAGCGAFVPQVVQCYNRGFDGDDFQWECKADMDNKYRFGSITVSCEGYDYPEDEYVLRGSCGLEYTIDLTQEGYEHKTQQSYSSHQPYSSKYHKTKSGFFTVENIVLGAGLGLVVYAIYKTCIAPTDHTDQRSRTNDDYGPRPDSSNRPPPAGFRSEYYQGSSSAPGGDSCSGGTARGSSGASSSGAGGFWTGAATGGLLGYMFGARNTNTGYNTYGAGTSRSAGWGFDNWGSQTGGYGGGYSGGGYSRPSTSSSGSRTASGFGGTTRR